MAHGAAHDAAEHVAAPLVRGQHAVGDQERARAQVVGDDAVGDPLRPVRVDARSVRDRADQRHEQVDLVIVVLALQHRGDALQPHAGVDRGLRQMMRSPGELLELHEDEVPDLDEAVAVRVGRARRAARNLVAVIVEDLGARAAGAGIAHLPEIIGAGDADDAGLRAAPRSSSRDRRPRRRRHRPWPSACPSAGRTLWSPDSRPARWRGP